MFAFRFEFGTRVDSPAAGPRTWTAARRLPAREFTHVDDTSRLSVPCRAENRFGSFLVLSCFRFAVQALQHKRVVAKEFAENRMLRAERVFANCERLPVERFGFGCSVRVESQRPNISQ